MENVAWPLRGRRVGQIWPGVARYWSSKGHDDEDSDEQLLLRLAHPTCLIREVHIQAFQAEFQTVSLLTSPPLSVLYQSAVKGLQNPDPS